LVASFTLVGMSRWAPNARERLEDAALELFADHGYEATSVAQIAERAGLNRATFFRHFADKREILFGGEERLVGLFVSGIREAGPEATLAECLQSALRAAASLMTEEQRRKADRRRSVAAANVEVQERGLLKRRMMAHAIAAALLDRGVDELTALLGAEIAILAFGIALQRWVGSDGADPFSVHAGAALGDLQARVGELEPPTSTHA
jgi:AcrR family transcriptional regulator